MDKNRLNLRNVAAIVACLAVTTMFSGCAAHNAAVSSAGAPFYLAYDSEEVIRDQAKVATITSTVGLEINGVTVNANNMRSANSSWAKKQIVVADVLPGKYQIRITHDPSGNPVRIVPITYNFEAGRIYDVSIQIIKAIVKENTSSDARRKIAENRNKAVFKSKK